MGDEARGSAEGQKRRNRPRSWFGAFLFTLAMAGVVAAGVLPSDTSLTRARPLDTLRVQLQWYHGVQFAGLYMAEHLGVFADSGLHVVLLAGGPTTDNAALVRNNAADIGLWTADQLLIRGAEPQPPYLRILGVVFNRSTAALALRDTLPIGGGGAWLAKRRAYIYEKFDTGLILELLEHRFGVEAEHHNAGQLDVGKMFEAQAADVWGVYVFNEPVTLRRDSVPFQLVRPEDVDLQYYSDTFFSTEGYLERHGDVLRRFLGASAVGWKAAVEEPEAAVDSMLARPRGALVKSNRSHYLAQLRELVAPSHGVASYLKRPLGQIAMFAPPVDGLLGVCTRLQGIKAISRVMPCDELVGYLVYTGLTRQ